MSNNLMLAKYGVVVPATSVRGYAFLPVLVKEQSLVRDFSLTGLSYEEAAKVNINLRIYVADDAFDILRGLGVEVKQAVQVATSPAEEEGEDPEVTETKLESYYVEYVMTQVDLGDDKKQFLLTSHPRFIKLRSKPKNTEIYDNRIMRYNEAISRLGETLEFQGEIDADDEDDAFTTGARLTVSAKEAQAEAHRRKQQKMRDYIEDTHRQFAPLLRSSEEPIELDVLRADYDISDDDGPLFNNERFLSDLFKEVIELESGN